VDVEFIPVGDAALLVRLGETIDLAVNRRVHALARQGRQSPAAARLSMFRWKRCASMAIRGTPSRSPAPYTGRWDELADEFYLFLYTDR
jgi:hypothetical protein